MNSQPKHIYHKNKPTSRWALKGPHISTGINVKPAFSVRYWEPLFISICLTVRNLFSDGSPLSVDPHLLKLRVTSKALPIFENQQRYIAPGCYLGARDSGLYLWTPKEGKTGTPCLPCCYRRPTTWQSAAWLNPWSDDPLEKWKYMQIRNPPAFIPHAGPLPCSQKPPPVVLTQLKPN